jgi:hypothetical protein
MSEPKVGDFVQHPEDPTWIGEIMDVGDNFVRAVSPGMLYDRSIKRWDLILIEGCECCDGVGYVPVRPPKADVAVGREEGTDE